ncbi:MAG: TonB-dependent siderophore receptor [Proteobacteria bacterium]|nr:TonB-dependent siderophore receptor [Pseudomonadota bacterium]
MWRRARRAAALAASCAPLAAWSQEAAVAAPSAASAPQTLQQVEIRGKAQASGAGETATGLGLTPRETPQSISVITRERIEDFGLADAGAVLASVTGINVERVETDRTYYTARGFDVTNFQLDGIGLPFANGSQWGDIDSAAYERIDVLRGANGLLSFTGNPSATINFVRKRPTAAFQASALVGIGSWNDRRLEADVSGAMLADGGVRGRLVVADEDRDSYLDRYHNHRTMASGLVDVDLGDRTVLSLGVLDQRTRARSPMWGALPLYHTDGTPTDYAVSTSTAADWAWWNNDDTRVTAELAHDFGNRWQAKATATYREQDADSELFYVYGTPDRTTGLGLSSYPSAFSGHYRQAMLDARASGPFTLGGREHQLMFGASIGRQNAHEHSGYGNDIGTPLPDLATWDGSYPKPAFTASSNGSSWIDKRSGAYGAVRFSLADPLSLVIGANVTRVSSEGENYGVPHAYTHTETTPYAGVVYDIDAHYSAYASYTKIFSPQTEVDANRQPLAPIQGSNVEAGIKADWLDGRLAGSLAVFRTRQANTAEAAGAFPDGASYYRPIAATSTGFEAEVTGRIAAGWDVAAGYTQLRLTDDATGADARTYVPRRTFRLSTTAQVPWLPALKLGASVAAQSAISTIDESAGFTATIRQGGYATLGLMARYEFDPHWSATLNLDNVADRKYLTSLYWTQTYYAPPRQARLSLRWTY